MARSVAEILAAEKPQLDALRAAPYGRRPMDVLIVGAGYLSRFLIPQLIAAGHRVTATTRSEERFGELESLGATPARFDVAESTQSESISAGYHVVIYSAAAGRGGDRAQVFGQGPISVLERVQSPTLKRFILTSSIGVFYRTDGEWIDEASAPRTEDQKGELLEGEVNLLTVNAPVTVLRLAGLYGPGRNPVDWMGDERKRDRICRGDPKGFVNWLRIEDAASAVLCTAEADDTAPLYNVVDDVPAVREEFYALACSLGAHPPLTFTGQGNLGKRVRNEKIKRDLGWAPSFPSYREGLRDLT